MFCSHLDIFTDKLKPLLYFTTRLKMGRRRNRFNKDVEKLEDSNDRKGYNDIVRENANFEEYYKMQGIVPTNEWDSFMATLRRNLPASFRITGYKGQAKVMLNIIRGRYFDELLKANHSEKDVCRPVCLPWYPDNLAWQMNLSRVVIRTSEDLKHLHNFLVSETETGNISRQETVSMIPPILLDVQPHHKVLDMCAAPGSKTAQIIEFLHKEEGNIPDGLVVANDVDNKRCYMLVHQAKRLNSPCFVIINNDGSNLPNIKIDKDDDNILRDLKFDRILCDVPCSGDGTVRKLPDIWQKWNTANAQCLHSLQMKIIRRGLELLAINGIMVYSTCSLNPIEDEAVISGILQSTGDSVELIDVSDRLTGLKTCKGVSDWKVTTRQLEILESFENLDETYLPKYKSSMFPPNPADSEKMHLERCLRILPHHQDTGGFFVAVLKKVKILPWESPEADADDQQECDGPMRKKLKAAGYKEDPFIFLGENDPDWICIREFYGLKGFDHTQLLCRCEEGKKRNLYFVSPAVKNMIQTNTGRVKIINTGVRMFCRSENKDARCPYRMTQEGLTTVLPYMSYRKVHLTKEDLILTLSNDFVEIGRYSQSLIKDFVKLASGCTVLIYTENSGTSNEFSIVVCGWKGNCTFRCYVPKPEKAHFLRICGVDVSEYEMREKKKFKIKQETMKQVSNALVETDEISTEKAMVVDKPET